MRKRRKAAPIPRIGTTSRAIAAPETVSGECDAHGEYTVEAVRLGAKLVGTRCPECSSAAEALELEERAAAREDWIARGRDGRSERAGVPERFRRARFADLTTGTDEHAAARAEAFGRVVSYGERFEEDAAKSGRCLLLFGRVGSGKTLAAVALVHHVLERRARRTSPARRKSGAPLYVTAPELLRRVSEARSYRRSPSAGAIIAECIGAELLVLDELGAHFADTAERATLFEILDGRSSSRRPTVVVSNLTIKELTEAFGEKFVDRLRADGGEGLPFAWPSWRRSHGNGGNGDAG